jgi:DegV family protein with EDD domain
MPRIQVVTDSACDLRPELADELGVRVVPLTIRFGDEELVDRAELSSKEFWDRVVTGPHMPQTAAPSPGAFQEVFEEAADAGTDGVICINLSSKVSGTLQSARTAADAVADRIRVEVVDSLTLTMGLGLVVIEAANLATTANSLDELVKAVGDAASRAHVFGVVDSLDFLRKGGRIGGASHLVGSLLSIKPVLDVRDGVVEVDSKQRTRARALDYLASKAVDAGPLERIALANGRSPDAQDVLELLRKAKSETPIEVSELGPVVGSHTGPASIAVCFIVARGNSPASS